MLVVDVYLRHLDKQGRMTHTAHRCWDADTFVRTQREAAHAVGGLVQRISQADYQNGLKPHG